MMFPEVSSELDRMWLVGRSVWQITLGLRGSETSTAVKFFGALSWASHITRRPSGAICSDMPSPMPPKPSSMWCDSSLKFQVTVPSALARPGPLLTAGFLTADAFFAVFFALALTAFFLAAGFTAFFATFLARFIRFSPSRRTGHWKFGPRWAARLACFDGRSAGPKRRQGRHTCRPCVVHVAYSAVRNRRAPYP